MTSRYTLGFRWVHWIMALVILTMLAFGQKFAGEMTVADRTFSLGAHASLGVLVVMFLLTRIVLRLTGRSGRPNHAIAPWQSLASKTVQAGIYLCLIFVPVTGILTARAHELPVQPFGMASISTSDPAFYDMIRPLHDYGTKALMLLLALHIGAALMHRFVLRDGVMASMSLLRQK
ncbi:cytochrome b/b6 domain-containing protein [Aliiroseovarius subalbicans]|uniref:cytochrome b n=1 Tax=Aliiroseovarius subalbicans TaxID=2925840 RepID=UPI001F59379E|nr:cytochrome b/b6 domain-containing protein [Aliiroseovarius subalbicans]MCI2398756.1 cytochrome b/b6 domain-containing protein [Aliiroseovarius subalbicans]